MKVICEVDHQEYYHRVSGKVLMKFEKGKVYEMVSQYSNCYMYFNNGECFLVKMIYFLTIEQVLKRGLLSVNK